MNNKRLEYTVEKRRNVHAKNQVEWTLRMTGLGGSSWVMFQWESCPTTQEVNDAVYIINRAMSVYHSQQERPEFPMFDQSISYATHEGEEND